MTARISFFGAAGEVTGSMHLLEAAGARILLDAGLFQGHRAESMEKNRKLPVDPRRLDAIIVSHAHIDHTGRLPYLVAEGFHGPIYATPATRDLMGVMLPDSANIQESDFRRLAKYGHLPADAQPLYRMADAIAVQDLVIGVPYRRPLNVRRHLSLEYHDAGHILGSASVDLRITEGGMHRLVFSGDIGRPGLPIIRDPQPPAGPVDTLIIESTYAGKVHDPIELAESKLGDIVSRVAARGGKLLIPSFAVGRTQELAYALHALHRAGRIPAVPIFIDSPLAVDATQVFRLHPEIFDRREMLVAREHELFDFPLVRYVRDVEESKRLNTLAGPAVIIAASGMVESGRILHHLMNHGGDHRNAILFVGFQAEHTLGRRIQQGADVMKIYGEEHPRRAEVISLDGYSAHADRNELRAWVRALGGPIKRAFCVHGERPALEAMAELLREEGVKEVIIPVAGESFPLG
jgi:metallo-beta-lactamase family protein